MAVTAKRKRGQHGLTLVLGTFVGVLHGTLNSLKIGSGSLFGAHHWDSVRQGVLFRSSACVRSKDSKPFLERQKAEIV